MNDIKSPKHNGARRFLRIGGPLILAVGGLFTLVGVGSFFVSMFTHAGPPVLFFRAFIGWPLMFIGGAMCLFGLVGAFARYRAGGTQDAVRSVARAAVAGFCIAAISCPQSVLACQGSAGTVCLVNPAACLKSMVLTKAVPMVVVFPPGGPAMFGLPITLFMTCPVTNNCGNACAAPGGPVASSLTISLYPGPPCPPVGPLPPPTASSTISSDAGTMTLPLCTSAGAFNAYVVGVTVPAGTPPGLYCVIGTATVTFPGGMVLTQTGDTVVCLVEQAPGLPGVPRLNLQLLSPNFPRMAPGDQTVARYRVTNNDPSNSVQLTAFATSKQAAVRPQGGNEAQGVFAISSPFGDDFPIAFDAGTNCIPLPDHPYIQGAISKPLPVLAPGQSMLITNRLRSYGQCASGSCSESTLRVAGTFADGSPAGACAGMSLMVDTSMASQNCGQAVNDCNQNGIPDALDIASRRSADQNFNAMPDECEQVISVPFFSSVSPTNPLPGAPIQVQVAFNEVIPMQSVWANGSSLTRTQFFGQPLWMGTIPADTRPGPQTVYFLGKDQRGGLSTYIGLYQVPPPPRITRIYFDGSRNAIIEHNGAQTGRSLFVQENPNLSCVTCWTNRPSGPHASPHNAGTAIGTRFFRLRD